MKIKVPVTRRKEELKATYARTQLYLNKKQHEYIKNKARQNRRTMAEEFRILIEKDMAHHNDYIVTKIGESATKPRNTS